MSVPFHTQVKHLLKDYNGGADGSGNSDDDGTVASGILDENICFECGMETIGEPDWEKLFLCDRCDGEYHLNCCYLKVAPRKSKEFTCRRCKDEFENLSKLD